MELKRINEELANKCKELTRKLKEYDDIEKLKSELNKELMELDKRKKDLLDKEKNFENREKEKFASKFAYKLGMTPRMLVQSMLKEESIIKLINNSPNYDEEWYSNFKKELANKISEQLAAVIKRIYNPDN